MKPRTLRRCQAIASNGLAQLLVVREVYIAHSDPSESGAEGAESQGAIGASFVKDCKCFAYRLSLRSSFQKAFVRRHCDVRRPMRWRFDVSARRASSTRR